MGRAMAGAGTIVSVPATTRRAACTHGSAFLRPFDGHSEELACEIDGNSSFAKWVHLWIDLHRHSFPCDGCNCSWPTEPHGRRYGRNGRFTGLLCGDPLCAEFH